nr:unnamed protein product [Spirometra erinaceieuropaei]
MVTYNASRRSVFVCYTDEATILRQLLKSETNSSDNQEKTLTLFTGTKLIFTKQENNFIRLFYLPTCSKSTLLPPREEEEEDAEEEEEEEEEEEDRAVLASARQPITLLPRWMVERPCRQWKTSLRTTKNSENWMDHLLPVPLGNRSVLKPDLDCSAAELVFGVTDPGEITSPTPPGTVEDTINLLYRFRQFVRMHFPVLLRPSVSESYLEKDLRTQGLCCTSIRTTAYHPAANGMVERFHRQLKASLRAAADSKNWTDHLPLVLLVIRSALKPDLDCIAAELVFGATVRLPGEMISPTPQGAVEDPTNLLHRLRQFMRTLSPRPPRSSASPSYLEKDLATCSRLSPM